MHILSHITEEKKGDFFLQKKMINEISFFHGSPARDAV